MQINIQNMAVVRAEQVHSAMVFLTPASIATLLGVLCVVQFKIYCMHLLCIIIIYDYNYNINYVCRFVY